jgi:hypothetical protein
MILLGVEFVIICALGYGLKKIFFDSITRNTQTNYLLTYEPTNYNNDNNNDNNNNNDYNINSEIPPKYEDVSNSSSSLISLPLYE